MRHKLFIVLLGVAAAGCGQRADQTPKPETTTSPEWIQGVGFTEPLVEVRRLSFKLPGVIDTCPVKLGQQVTHGEILMTLCNHAETAELAAAESELILANAERDKVLSGINPFQISAAEYDRAYADSDAIFAKKMETRQTSLAKNKAISIQDGELAITDSRKKQAALHRAEATLAYLHNYVRPEDRVLCGAKVALAAAHVAVAKARLEDTILRAPFDGTVLEILRREGETTQEQVMEPVMIFGDPNHLRIRAEFDENFAMNLQVGQKAIAFGRGLANRQVEGQVVFVKSLMGKKTVFAHYAAERKDSMSYRS